MPSNPPHGSTRPPIRRRYLVLGGLVAAILLLIILFDWNWFRKPLERYVSDKTQREFRISDLDVDLGWTPTIKVRDVYFANAPWSNSREPMARIGALEFSVSLRDYWRDRKFLVPRVALSQAALVFERAQDGSKNWVLKEPSESAEPSSLRISSLSVDEGKLRYEDHGEPMVVDVEVSTFDPKAAAKAPDAKAGADNSRYTTRYKFAGRYHEAAFQGDAMTGDVLSFQESDIPFPIQGSLRAGSTRATIEGTIADVVNLSAIDVRLAISGQTLASLYPFLLLPLPASPPYAFSGHLVQKGARYSIDDLVGKIGETDVEGEGAYVQRESRPLLTGKLRSKLLNLADLGPIIGVQTRGTGAATSPAGAGAAARPLQSDTNTREAAQAKERQSAGGKVLPSGSAAPAGDGILPSGKFEGGRLKAIDAEIDYAAARLKAPAVLAVEDLKFNFQLHDAVAKLAPLDIGYAGGRIISEITIDARQDTLRSSLNADFRNLQLAKLFPTLPEAAQGVGAVGAQIRLQGSGNSIAEAAGASNGTLTAAVSKGRLSNLLDALAGLNGGKVITLLMGGDQDISVNCGAASFRVRDGLGQSEFFVVDTAQTRIDGSGSFNLKNETLDLRVEPKPKSAGILSLRSPLYVRGSFRSPDAGIEKGPLLARAGGAIALALVNPLAALLPLIETGPGTDVDCARVLAPVKGAQAQSAAKGKALPQPAAPATRK